jgi:FHA domain
VTEHGVLPGLWPIHGDGVLARQGDLVLLIHPAGGAFTDRLLDLLANTARAGHDGLRFTDQVSAEFDADAAAADPAGQQGPAVVAFGPAGGGTAVAVYGTGWAEVTTAHGLQRLTAGEPYGRLRCVMPSTLIKLRAGVQSVPGDAETDPYLRLADGMVRAVALLYAPAEISADAADRARPATPGQDRVPDVSPAVPLAADQLQTAPPEPEPEPEPEPVLGQAPAPYADRAEMPEPEYHPTRIEPSVPMPPPPAQVADPYGQPAADPYGPPAADPYGPPGADPYASPPRAEPYAPAAPPPGAEPYAPRAADPYAPPGPPRAADPYAPIAPDPYAPPPGLAGGPPDAASPQDFISISFVSADMGGEVPSREPLPLGAEPPEAKDLGLVEMPSAMVEGVYCKNGHFNDPEAKYCAVCGISMGQLTKIRQKGKRPPLGVLVLGDGSVCQLDADYVIGREPTLDSSVAEGRARPLRLMGASGVVSRIHARVDLDGWQVFLTDLNSANGTQVLLPGERNPANLQAGVRTPLVAGAQIRLGGEYALQYDSHRHR